MVEMALPFPRTGLGTMIGASTTWPTLPIYSVRNRLVAAGGPGGGPARLAVGITATLVMFGRRAAQSFGREPYSMGSWPVRAKYRCSS